MSRAEAVADRAGSARCRNAAGRLALKDTFAMEPTIRVMLVRFARTGLNGLRVTDDSDRILQLSTQSVCDTSDVCSCLSGGVHGSLQDAGTQTARHWMKSLNMCQEYTDSEDLKHFYVL